MWEQASYQEFYTPLVPKGYDFLGTIGELAHIRQDGQVACGAKSHRYGLALLVWWLATPADNSPSVSNRGAQIYKETYTKVTEFLAKIKCLVAFFTAVTSDKKCHSFS